MTKASSYYDIDAILAEEELIPCTTLFDFSHLNYLDPDAATTSSPHGTTHLREGSQIKMPLWAVDKWASLGYVRLALPRHYSRKARERLEADPGDADLRKRTERFFQSGKLIVDLIERSSIKVAKVIAKTKSSRRSAHTRALEQASAEAQELRRTLVTSFAGERLRRTFDWALSSGGDDDVSHYLSRLTEMEQRLFRKGAEAVSAHEDWMTFGNRQWFSNHRKVITTPGPVENTSSRAVTPLGGEATTESADDGNHRDKRQRFR